MEAYNEHWPSGALRWLLHGAELARAGGSDLWLAALGFEAAISSERTA